MQRSDRALLRVPPVSQVVHRIVGNSSGLSQVVGPRAGPSCSLSQGAGPRDSTSTDHELSRSFPGLYGPRPGHSRHQPYSRPKPRYNYKPRPPKNFLKQVVLVGPGVNNVPRGQLWQDLHDQGCVADVMEFCGAWNQTLVFDALESAFSKVLDQSTPPPRYA